VGVELLKQWLRNRPKEAKRKDAEAVLTQMGCEIRHGGENHLIAYHPDLVDHPQFRNGMITVNCHAFGKSGAVHPRAIEDIVKAAKCLEKKEEK